MLTMKYLTRPSVGVSTEYVRSIGSFSVRVKDGQLQFLAYDDEHDDRHPSIWGGQVAAEGISDPVVGMIYVMNDSGATIADYRFVFERSSIVDDWK